MVIGGGVAGTAAFIALVRRAAAAEIDIVDPLPPGACQAFATTEPALLCNTSIDLMSLVPGLPDDFLAYLRGRGIPAIRDDVAPRSCFADYARDRYRAYAELAGRIGIAHRRVGRRAVAVRRSVAGGYRVILDDGHELAAEDVIIALGWGAPVVPELVREHVGRELLFTSPFPERAMLGGLPPAARVLVIGTGLSAIDTALLLCARGHQVLMASPSGDLPAVRTRTIRSAARLVEPADLAGLDPMDPCLDRRMAAIVARAARRIGPHRLANQVAVADSGDRVERLRAETDLALRGITHWQDVLVDLIDAANAALMRLDPAARDTALTTCAPLIRRYLGALVLSNARLLLGHFDGGRARIRAGVPSRLSAREHGPRWRGHWPGGHTEDFDAVVCATGFTPPRLRADRHGLELMDRPGRPLNGLPEPDLDLRVRLPGHEGPGRHEGPERIWLLGLTAAARVPFVNAAHHAVEQADQVATQIAGAVLADRAGELPRYAVS